MSLAGQVDDPGAEREIDLSRWRRAAVEQWWLVVGGILAGVVVGALLALGGGSYYRAAVLLAPGQPFTPTGTPTLSYLTSPRAVNEIATSEGALKQAAAAAGVPVGRLRGRVSSESVETGTGAAAARSAVLIRVTVRLPKARQAEKAANRLAAIIVDRTTSDYVRTAIATYEQKLASLDRLTESTSKRIDQLNTALASEKQLDPLQQLVLVSQLDNAEQRLGNFQEQRVLTEQQLTLARNVMLTQVIQDAVGVKTTARSLRNSILVGALIGLVLGAIAAVVADWRAARARPA